MMTSASIAILLLTSFQLTSASAFNQQDPVIAETKFEIDEELPAGTSVGSLRDSPQLRRRYPGEDGSGVEIDVVDRMRFTFRQRQSSSPYEYFSIDEQSGEIHTRERIDRERVCPTPRRSAATPSLPASSSCRLVLDVSVRPIRYYQILRVVVEVRDVNDNAPRFAESRTTIQIPELAASGTSFELPAASDDDASPNGIRDYFLAEPSDFFELEIVAASMDATPPIGRELRRRQLSQTQDATHPQSVRLRLKATLDREISSRHRVVVVAVDGGSPPRSGSVEVDVVVIDANDNAPRFDRLTYDAEISENRKSRMPIVRLSASDADDGDNGVVFYSLLRSPMSSGNINGSTGASSLFRIDADTGDLFPVRSLDRETDGNVFHLTAVASDRGPNPLSAFVPVTIIVRDENDNAPEISVIAAATTTSTESSEFVQPEIAENADYGTFVAQVVAIDRDEGPNGSVECWTDGRLFRLEPVTLASTVIGQYGGNEEAANLSAGERKDEGDNYEEEVLNGRLPATRGGRRRRGHRQLHRRGGRRIQRSTRNDIGGGRSEYQLRSVASFDREVASDVIATVYCRDAGSPSLRVAMDIVVRVVDVNDHAPVIVVGGGATDRLTVDVVEGNQVGAEIFRVATTDADIGNNAVVDFDLVPIKPDDVVAGHAVSIDRHSGIILAEISFDYESRSTYEYLVTVTDQATTTGSGNQPSTRLSTTATVVVRVRDADDERPRFDRASYHFSVRENVALGTAVGRVTATDADLTPRFSRVAYHIQYADAGEIDDGGASGRTPFEVDRQTGQITTSGRIDREEIAIFRFTVVATSGDSVEAASDASGRGSAVGMSATVTVYVDDENDNAPVVRFPSPVVWIHSGHLRRCHVTPTATSGGGCLITRIEATDADEGENARLTYEFAATASAGSDVRNTSPSSLSPTSALSPFTIDPVTGVVTFTGQPPPLKDSADDSYATYFRLLVTVRDNGLPQRTSIVDLSVNINTTSASSSKSAITPVRRRISADGNRDAVAEEDDEEESARVRASLSASTSGLSDERLMILLGMICGVVVITLIASTLCCFFVLRRRSRRGGAKADDVKSAGDVDGVTKGSVRDSMSGLSGGGRSSSMVDRGRLSGSTTVRAPTVADESTSCALYVEDWRVEDSIEAGDRTSELIRADIMYNQMLDNYCIQRPSNGTSHNRLPDMVPSHSTTAHLASIGVADMSAEYCCSNCRHPRHHSQNHRHHSQHNRRQQLTGSSRDVVRGNRTSSPCCSSGCCCCSDSGSTTAPLHSSATWRTSMTSSPDLFIETATGGATSRHGGGGRYTEHSASTSVVDSDSDYSGELSSTSTCIDSGMAPSDCSDSKRHSHRRRQRHGDRPQHHHHQHCRRHRDRQGKLNKPDPAVHVPQQTSLSGTDVVRSMSGNDVVPVVGVVKPLVDQRYGVDITAQ